MNKNSLKIVLFLIILSLISYLVYNVVSKTQKKHIITNRIKTIPEFDFTTLDKTKFKKGDLKPNITTVFLYFNSECDYCQYEAQSISNNIDKFKNIQLIFVSTEPIEKIKTFSDQYNLNNKPHITFLYDGTDNFSSQFNATSIPFTLIYDENQNLIKAHKGQLNAIGILQIINK